jgi:uncharacterized membrane protein YdbT with pleckstrin-like domain
MLTDAEKKRIEEEEAYRAQVRARLASGETSAIPTPPDSPEEELYKGSPSMRAHPGRFWGSSFIAGVAIAAVIAGHQNGQEVIPERIFVHVLWLIPLILLIEAIFLGIWWFNTRSALLIITNRKTVMELGWFSKSRTEVFHNDVRTVEIQQSFINRLTGHGSLQISSAGESDWEIKVADLPRVKEARDLIQQYRKR